MGKILITGSTGNVGKRLTELLRAAGETVLAASRKGDVPFDYADPSTWAGALDGVDRVFLVSPPGVAAAHELLGPFIQAAGARKFVLLSADGVQYNEEAPLRKVERLIEASGGTWVFLRPNWYMDNFHTFWLAPVQQAGVIPVPAAESKSAFIDSRDIAASAAAVLTTSSFDGQAFSLSGPEALTYAEAAQVLSKAAGRELRYVDVPEKDFIASLQGAGLPEDYAAFLALLFSFVRLGASAPVTGAVKELTGKDPKTLAEYAADHEAAWRQ